MTRTTQAQSTQADTHKHIRFRFRFLFQYWMCNVVVRVRNGKVTTVCSYTHILLCTHERRYNVTVDILNVEKHLQQETIWQRPCIYLYDTLFPSSSKAYFSHHLKLWMFYGHIFIWKWEFKYTYRQYDLLHEVKIGFWLTENDIPDDKGPTKQRQFKHQQSLYCGNMVVHMVCVCVPYRDREMIVTGVVKGPQRQRMRKSFKIFMECLFFSLSRKVIHSKL